MPFQILRILHLRHLLMNTYPDGHSIHDRAQVAATRGGWQCNFDAVFQYIVDHARNSHDTTSLFNTKAGTRHIFVNLVLNPAELDAEALFGRTHLREKESSGLCSVSHLREKAGRMPHSHNGQLGV